MLCVYELSCTCSPAILFHDSLGNVHTVYIRMYVYSLPALYIRTYVCMYPKFTLENDAKCE